MGWLFDVIKSIFLSSSVLILGNDRQDVNRFYEYLCVN
jgi:hypothetical protein